MKKLFLLLVFLLFASNADATKYWTDPAAVSTTLSSCDGDTDPGSYCTFASIYSGMSGGDTLVGKAGTYNVRIGTAPKAGPSASQKTLFTCETAADPTNGVDPVCILRPSGSGGFVVIIGAGANNWSWQNWKFDSGAGSSVSTCVFHLGSSNGTTSNYELINNEFTAEDSPAGDPGTGAIICGGTLGSNGLISNNHIHHCERTGNPDCHGFYQNSHNLTFEQNLIHDIGRVGGNAYGVQYYSSSGTAFTGGVIRFNRIHTANRGILVGASNTGAEVYGNVIYNVETTGITPRQANGKVYNNSIDVTGTAISVENNCSASCTVRNNLATTSGSLGSATASNNSFSVTDTSHWIDPNNATMASRDYNLKEGSTAIAGGTRTSLPSGYTCVATGSTCDQGAYQAPVRSAAVVQDATDTKYNITFLTSSQSVRDGVGLKGCTTADWAIVVAAAGVTETACDIVGTNRVDITIPTVTTGQSLTDAYTRGTLTDNVNIGGTFAKVRTYSAASGTNNVDGAGGVVFTAIHYRCLSWYADTSPASTDWLRAEDASNSTLPCPLRAGGLGAVAIAIDGTGADPDPTSFEWYGNNNGGAYAALTNTASATALAFANINAPALSDGQAISATILTDPHTSFVAGAVIGQQSSQPTVDLSEDSTTNVILLIKSDAAAAVGDTFCVQPALAGGDPTSITQTKTACFEITNPSAGM